MRALALGLILTSCAADTQIVPTLTVGKRLDQGLTGEDEGVFASVGVSFYPPPPTALYQGPPWQAEERWVEQEPSKETMGGSEGTVVSGPWGSVDVEVLLASLGGLMVLVSALAGRRWLRGRAKAKAEVE